MNHALPVSRNACERLGWTPISYIPRPWVRATRRDKYSFDINSWALPCRHPHLLHDSLTGSFFLRVSRDRSRVSSKIAGFIPDVLGISKWLIYGFHILSSLIVRKCTIHYFADLNAIHESTNQHRSSLGGRCLLQLIGEGFDMFPATLCTPGDSS
jgi:hypothetical protein